jgi:hypothetical protein
MEYVHRCIVCDWQRSASSPTVTSPRCDNCGCALEAAVASDLAALRAHGEGIQVPERLRLAARRFGIVAGILLLAIASARTGYAAGGVAIAVSAVGVAGLFVVMAMTAQRA